MRRRIAMKKPTTQIVVSRIVGLLLVGTVIWLTGCSPIVRPPETGTIPSAPTELPAEEEIMPAAPANAPQSAEPPLVQQAKADLAERLSIAPEEIEMVELQDVAWRDGSMGCPEPDMMYTQVIIEGQRIILSVGGEEYHYHAGGNRAPFLCEKPAENGAVGS